MKMVRDAHHIHIKLKILIHHEDTKSTKILLWFFFVFFVVKCLNLMSIVVRDAHYYCFHEIKNLPYPHLSVKSVFYFLMAMPKFLVFSIYK